MSIHKSLATAAMVFAAAPAVHAESPDLGKALAPDEIPTYARYVMPDGRGLPPGSGTAKRGAGIYAERCARCHGATGVEGPIEPPVGPNKVWAKPAGRYWPYATTLFAYIKRAMPFDAPKSLSNDEVYALAAYILFRNGVIEGDQVMDARTLPKVEMPNRNNFIDVWATQGAKPW